MYRGLMYRILSIDGGGIRGLIPALVLAEIEARAERPVHRLFDMVAGTSTGGILGLGLTVPTPDKQTPYSARALVGFYETHGPTIFDGGLWNSIRTLAAAKYPEAPLENVLKEFFGGRMLSEALLPLIVCGYEIERRTPWFFKRRGARNSPETHDFQAWRVARSTSAAPTYFRPHRINASTEHDYFGLVDGGVFANNPSMCALVEAMSRGAVLDEIALVSLGTGNATGRIPLKKARKWGLMGWAPRILDMALSGVSDTVDYQLQQLLGGDDQPGHYVRLQPRLCDENEALDNAATDNLRDLRTLAVDLINRRTHMLDEWVELLTVGQPPEDTSAP